MWANRLRDMQTGYFSESGIDTLEKLSDAMLAEQLCNGLPELAKKYVLDKQAKTVDECATEADRWFLGTRLCDTKPGTKANYHSMRIVLIFMRGPTVGISLQRRHPPVRLMHRNRHHARQFLNHVMCELAGIAVQTPMP